MLPRVFVGSSTEAFPIAVAVQTRLTDRADVITWKDGVFGPSEFTLESLINSLDLYDFAIFVMGADDISTIRNQSHKVARDNVIFEMGLFMSRLGRERTFLLKQEDVRGLTDVGGLNYARFRPYEPRNFRSEVAGACEEIGRKIDDLGSIKVNRSPQAQGSTGNDALALASIARPPSQEQSPSQYTVTNRTITVEIRDDESRTAQIREHVHLIVRQDNLFAIRRGYSGDWDTISRDDLRIESPNGAEVSDCYQSDRDAIAVISLRNTYNSGDAFGLVSVLTVKNAFIGTSGGYYQTSAISLTQRLELQVVLPPSRRAELESIHETAGPVGARTRRPLDPSQILDLPDGRQHLSLEREPPEQGITYGLTWRWMRRDENSASSEPGRSI